MATETLIIPIAGAGNCGRDRVSTAAPHFYFLLRSLKKIPEVKVVNPLVPAGFGVFGSLEKSYNQVTESIEKIETKRPDSKKIVVGHSLGGLLGRRLVMEGWADCVLGIGSPQNGLRRIVPANTRAAYLEFSQATANEANPGRLALIGYRNDELVQLESSLAELKNADRYEFEGATTHNLMLLSSGVIDLSTRIVRTMIELDASISEPLTELPRPA